MLMTKKRITIEFTEDILGALPKNPNIYKDWVESKKPEEQKEAEAKNVPVDETKTDDQLKGWTGFLQDEDGIYVYDYVCKGFFKYAGGIMAEELKTKQLKSKIIKNLFILPRKLHFTKDGKTFDKPAGYIERGLQVMVPTGPRNTLMRSDVLPKGTQLTFTVAYRKSSPITGKIVDGLLEYGAFCGLCQWRTGGYGKFKVVLNELVEGEPDKEEEPKEEKVA